MKQSECDYTEQLVVGVLDILDEDKVSAVCSASVGMSITMTALQSMVEDGNTSSLKNVLANIKEIIGQFEDFAKSESKVLN